MTDFNRLASYEAIRDPVSGAVLFTGTKGLAQAKVRRKIVEDRQKEQDLIRELARTVAELKAQL